MFITRATRHDHADVKALYESEEGWEDHTEPKGTIFIARDGGVVGSLRLIDIEPQKVAVDAVLVRSDRRGSGIGTQLMKAAMNSRGGTLYLCCHEERIAFYERLGFEAVPFEELPRSAQRYFEEQGDWPDRPDHRHYFMKAR